MWKHTMPETCSTDTAFTTFISLSNGIDLFVCNIVKATIPGDVLKIFIFYRLRIVYGNL